MNFKISAGKTILKLNNIGDVLFHNSNLKIESDFKTIKVHQTNNMVICLGDVDVKSELNNPLDYYFKQINSTTIVDISQQLEGRFVLICIDNNGNFSLCLDQFAKLDVYYQKTTVGIALTSNLDLLPESPEKFGFNQVALTHMLTYYGYCPPKKQTIYNSVSRLGVGEVAIVKNNKLIIEQQVFSATNSYEYTNDKHDRYSEIFLSHLKKTASSKGNVVYLSSGWDSTSILAGLVHSLDKTKVRGLIGKMKYSTRSGCCNQIELDKAQKIADYYGIELETVDFDLTKKDDVYFDELKTKMLKHQLYAVTAITHDKLAEKTAQITQENEIIFAGEISDGAHNLGFSQYVTIFHPSYGFREYADKMASYLFGPTFLSLLINGQYVNDPIYQLFKAKMKSNLFDDIKSTPEDIKLQLLSSFFLRNARIPLWSLDNEPLLTQKGKNNYTQEMQQIYLTHIAKDMNIDNIYASYLYLYNSFHWQGGTVRSLQTMADYYQLKTDMPFWNSYLQEFLSKMPEDWGRGLDLNPTKYPLKNMLKEKINYPYDYQKGPHSYTYDIDYSFSHAQEVYCYSALTEDFQNSVRRKPYHQILSQEYFDLNYIDDLVDEYTKSSTSISVAKLTKLVPIIMLCYVGWYGKHN